VEAVPARIDQPGVPSPIGSLAVVAPLSPPAIDGEPAAEEVARALRGARARTGMTEHQVVAVLAEQGFSITVTRLRGWERTGVIRVDAASRLADAYGITIDTLAGRRAYRSRHHSAELPSDFAGP
jgi:hypothetical protein